MSTDGRTPRLELTSVLQINRCGRRARFGCVVALAGAICVPRVYVGRPFMDLKASALGMYHGGGIQSLRKGKKTGRNRTSLPPRWVGEHICSATVHLQYCRAPLSNVSWACGNRFPVFHRWGMEPFLCWPLSRRRLPAIYLTCLSEGLLVKTTDIMCGFRLWRQPSDLFDAVMDSVLPILCKEFHHSCTGPLALFPSWASASWFTSGWIARRWFCCGSVAVSIRRSSEAPWSHSGHCSVSYAPRVIE